MLIRNAKDSAGKAVEVWLRDGKIAAVGLGLLVPEGEEVLDAKGRTVLPAFIDTHCHWRTPGFEYKEDISTGSAAAAAGGYTFVNLMPNTKPVCSSAEIAHAVEAEAARVGLCDANQTVSITKDFDGKTLDHLLTLPEDIKFITEDGNGVMNNAVMARAFAIATERGLTIMSHAEDREISPWDYRLAENIETVRNCHLAEYYGTRLHMCHVSTRESVDAVRMSRMRGARVSCEVTPHHLWFDDSRLTYRVNPPIRKADDVTALIDAIKDGTVTCIGTDHAPHTAEEKEKGAAGMVGLETAFGVCYTKLCRTSNPGAKDFEYKKLDDGRHVYDLVGDSLTALGKDYMGEHGYSSIGLVIGGTHTEEATAIRAAYKDTFFLIPGYGAQGGKAADIAQYLTKGNGGVVNSSRGILLAYKKQPGVAFDEAAYNECVRMREDIQGECNKL